MGSHIYGVASLNMEEMGWSGLLGLGKNLGRRNMILTTVRTCHQKRIYNGGVFGYFEALMGAFEVTETQHGLPRCG